MHQWPPRHPRAVCNPMPNPGRVRTSAGAPLPSASRALRSFASLARSYSPRACAHRPTRLAVGCSSTTSPLPPTPSTTACALPPSLTSALAGRALPHVQHEMPQRQAAGARRTHWPRRTKLTKRRHAPNRICMCFCEAEPNHDTGYGPKGRQTRGNASVLSPEAAETRTITAARPQRACVRPSGRPAAAVRRSSSVPAPSCCGGASERTVRR